MGCDLPVGDSMGSDLDGMKEASWLKAEVNVHIEANKDLSQPHAGFLELGWCSETSHSETRGPDP